MEKLYRVTFTHRGQEYQTEVEADSKTDAIDQAMEIGFGEEWEAVLIAIDGVPVNVMPDTEKHAKCRDVLTGLCICGTCKNDHGQDGDTPPCCLKHYGIYKCPIIKCPHYEKEDTTGKDVE